MQIIFLFRSNAWRLNPLRFSDAQVLTVLSRRLSWKWFLAWRHKVVTWINHRLFPIGPLWTSFIGIGIKIRTFHQEIAFENVQLRPLRLGFNALKITKLSTTPLQIIDTGVKLHFSVYLQFCLASICVSYIHISSGTMWVINPSVYLCFVVTDSSASWSNPGPLSTKQTGVFPQNVHKKVSKPRHLCLKFSNRSEIWQALRQQRCRGTCQISELYGHYNTQCRGFETSRYLTVRCPSAQWIEALKMMNKISQCRTKNKPQ